MRLLRFLTLVVLLNVIRYVIGFPLESVATHRLFAEMERHSAIFNNNFTTLDWVTSFFYNFVMWLTAEWMFALLEPRLRGNILLKSFQTYGLMLLFFCSISAIYMNHYSHPKWFYVWNMLDAVIVYALVAVANGLLFPLFFRGAPPTVVASGTVV